MTKRVLYSKVWPGELVGAREWVATTKMYLLINKYLVSRRIIVDPKKQKQYQESIVLVFCVSETQKNAKNVRNINTSRPESFCPKRKFAALSGNAKMVKNASNLFTD